MTDPRVVVYPADKAGVGFYRMIAPASTLIAAGHPVVVGWDHDESMKGVFFDERTFTNLIEVRAPDCDVVVFQRPLRSIFAKMIPLLQAQGIACVVEVDDDFDTIHPSNAAFRASQPKADPKRNRQWLHEACRLADLVTVSTPSLLERYGYGHGRVLRNMVPSWYLGIGRDDPHEMVAVGWTGSVFTHPDDLQVMGSSIVQCLDAGGCSFNVVGNGERVKAALRVPNRHEVLCSGWQNLSYYPLVMAELDVGVVPLTDTAFNRAKSWLKGLEFAAVGVPFVASDLPEYRELNRRGAGLLVSKQKQWRATLRSLIESAQFRDDVAAVGRVAASQLTVEAHAWRWYEAWADALLARRGLVAV